MSFQFDGSMPRDVLESYLGRSITMAQLLCGNGAVDDNIRMLKNIGAKFVGRAYYYWGAEQALMEGLPRARAIAEQAHSADPEMILQGGIFEIVTTQVDAIPVPGWAFAGFDLPTEERCFHYQDMIYADGLYVDHWQPGASVPDITRIETRLWIYFLAGSFLQAGIEAIHFGQIMLIGRNDPDLAYWADVLGRIRAFAHQQARRHFVLCDAHVSSGVGCYGLSDDAAQAPGGYRRGDHLLLDVHALPLRIKEVPGRPQEAELAMGHLDALFGRSLGGISPSGWVCEHLPYLVEFDNYGSTGHGGESVTGKIGALVGIDDRYWIWGYDEITWFAHQDEAYRNRWLHYAMQWVRTHDANGFLLLPGMRILADPVDGRSEYYANTCSPACPAGQNQEETIKAIWASANP